jgi:RNA-directed DNA polymerase
VKAFYDKVSSIVGRSLSVPTERLIQTLNPVLQGWARYHRGVVAKETFSKLDHQIFWRLLRWGRRRHPRKSGKWVYETYWRTLGSRTVFSGVGTNRRGEPATYALYSLADTPIVRHVKVQVDYNPFDPDWEHYGEQRHAALTAQAIVSNARWTLWTQQGGRCALCEALIDSAETADDHHIVYRMHGGSNALANRVLLHPVCHRRVHALGLEVTKPVPAEGL